MAKLKVKEEFVGKVKFPFPGKTVVLTADASQEDLELVNADKNGKGFLEVVADEKPVKAGKVGEP